MTGLLIQRLAQTNAAICLWGRRIAGVCLAVMALLVLAQVVARFGFGRAFAWTEELSKTLMVWMTLAVVPWGYRSGAHLSLKLFTEAFPKRFGAAVESLVHGLVLGVAGVLLLESLAFVAAGRAIRAASLDLSLAWFYAITPLSFGALVLVVIERLGGSLHALMPPRAR